jgi:hypothetical protein
VAVSIIDSGEAMMKAHVGDRVVVAGTHVGEAQRVGVITQLRHPDGTPPYLVRWLDSGHEGLVFPGPDAHIEPVGQPPTDG